MSWRKIASLAASLLLLTATGAAAAVTPKPTTTAITYWKRTVLKPANLPNWWDGYLNHAHLTSRRWMSTKGIRFYDCRIETRIDNTAPAPMGSSQATGRPSTIVTVCSSH